MHTHYTHALVGSEGRRGRFIRVKNIVGEEEQEEK